MIEWKKMKDHKNAQGNLEEQTDASIQRAETNKRQHLIGLRIYMEIIQKPYV